MDGLSNEIVLEIVKNCGNIFDRFNFARTCQKYFGLSKNRTFWINLNDDITIRQVPNIEPSIVTVNQHTYKVETFSHFMRFCLANKIQLGNLILVGVADGSLIEILIQFFHEEPQMLKKLKINMKSKGLPMRMSSIAHLCDLDQLEELDLVEMVIDESLIWFMERCGSLPNLKRFRFAQMSNNDYNGNRIRYVVEQQFPEILTGKVLDRLEIDLFGWDQLYVATCALPRKVKHLVLPKCPNFLAVLNKLREQNQIASLIELEKLETMVPAVYMLTASIYLIRIRDILINLDDIQFADDSFAYNFDLFLFKTFANHSMITEEKSIKIVSRFHHCKEFATLLRCIQNWARVQDGLKCDTGNRQSNAFEDKFILRTRTNNNKFVVDLLFFSM